MISKVMRGEGAPGSKSKPLKHCKKVTYINVYFWKLKCAIFLLVLLIKNCSNIITIRQLGKLVPLI
jgi:hypothetical protein